MVDMGQGIVIVGYLLRTLKRLTTLIRNVSLPPDRIHPIGKYHIGIIFKML